MLKDLQSIILLNFGVEYVNVRVILQQMIYIQTLPNILTEMNLAKMNLKPLTPQTVQKSCTAKVATMQK